MSTITFSLLLTLTIITNIAFAFDPRPLQDFCVADLNSTLLISGALPCKNPRSVTADDFYYTGLNIPSNTSNPFGAGFKVVDVKVVPGLNTLGLTLARLDIAAGGIFPLHNHPRASELFLVTQGKLEVGFVSPDQGYKYYKKTLSAGDVYVVPPGLIHSLRNVGMGPMVLYAIFNSQNPGFDITTQSVFGANPAIEPNYLARVYNLDVATVRRLQQGQ